MKAAFIGSSSRIDYVFSGGRREKLVREFDLCQRIVTKESLQDPQLPVRDIEILFSTWGMPALTGTEISRFTSLKALFYAAGSVQAFARPFIESGIKVISAWGANAVPVCEYTVAQILLANKGFFRAAKAAGSRNGWKKYKTHGDMPGNFETEVALLGAGMIGRGVIRLLKPYMLNVIVFDPFLPEAGASALGVQKVELAEAFRRGAVVSNHIANLPETKGMLKGEHFASMRPNATFINTGRGATVDEPAMIKVLEQRPDLTAVLDVTYPEPPEENSKLYTLENVVMTPHIAGSAGNEVRRMADFMVEEATAFRDGKALKYEVTLSMLETMA